MAIGSVRSAIDKLKEKYEFRHNLGNNKMEFRLIGEETFRDLTDFDFNSMKVMLELNGVSCSKENLRSIIFSDLWEQFDPYKEFLKNLPLWDGHDHIADLAATVKTDDDEYWLWCFKKWLVGFVGSLADDETVNQTAPILSGGQGAGKSSWFKSILPPELKKYMSSGFLQPRDKETLVQLSELCLYIMDEVENLKPRNIEAIKELITKSEIYLRRAYTTLSQKYIRRCSFCGTSNEVNILHDLTGNRRFLCQKILDVDYMLSGIDLSQVYAQAYQLFRSGFQFWFDNEDQAKVEEHNKRFRAESVEEQLISTYLEPCLDGEEGAKRLAAYEIQTYLYQMAPKVKLSPVTIGKVLSAKGYTQKKSNTLKWIVRLKEPNA